MDESVGGRDKALEERMRPVWFALEFGVELAGDEKGMVLQFNNLDQLAVRRRAAEYEARLLELFPERIVELVPMPVPLINKEGAVEMVRPGSHGELARL